MNDLMTKSFLSYVELNRQAQMDLKAELDLETGQSYTTEEEENLSQFFKEVSVIKGQTEEITNLLIDLQTLNEQTKSTHNPKLLRGIRDRMESNTLFVLRKAKMVKARLESLDRSNMINRTVYIEGSMIDRTRNSVTSGLRVKLRDVMNDFQSLRERVVFDHKENLKRRYFNEIGEEPSEEVIEKMGSGNLQMEMFKEKLEGDLESKERHEAVMGIRRSLDKLHQVFLDMNVLVENQAERLDDIEQNVAVAGSYINGGTDSLLYAKEMKKSKKWVYWVWAVGLIILLVCFISLLNS